MKTEHLETAQSTTECIENEQKKQHADDIHYGCERC